MTEKRFQEYYQGNTIVSIHDKENNNELVNILQCVELLNEQHETITQLQSANMEMEDYLARLEEENEQLKSFVEYEKRQHKHWKRECLENIKEIAQLKREITQLKGDV